MPDSLMDLGQQQPQQPIPSGPTVQPQPFSTSGLADVLNLVIPAIVGSQLTRYNPNGTQSKAGALGAMAGIGAGEEAMQDQRKRAQAYRQAEEENKYKAAITEQATANAERIQTANSEARKRMSNIDELLKSTPDPKERQKIMDDPEGWIKEQTIKAHIPGSIAQIGKLSKGVIAPDMLADMPPERILGLEESLLDRAARGSAPNVAAFTGPDGRQYIGTVDSKGDFKQLQPPGGKGTQHLVNNNTTGKQELVTSDSQGEVIRRVPVGDMRLTGPERIQQHSETVALSQAQSVMDALDKIDPKDNLKMSRQAYYYQNPGKAGALTQLTGGKMGLDPDYVSVFSQMGQLEASLQRALSNGRVSQALYTRLISHVPNVGDPPTLIAEKIRSMAADKGLMKETRDAIKGEEEYYKKHPEELGLQVGAKNTTDASEAKAEPAPSLSDDQVKANIEKSIAAGHPVAEIAAKMKAIGLDPQKYGLGGGALAADTAALKAQYVGQP